MDETLVCDVCQQAWDALDGDDCIFCGRKGRRVEEVTFDKPELSVQGKVRRRKRSDYVRLSVKTEHIVPLLLILHGEVARVGSIAESARTDNDKGMLSCAEDLLQRLSKTLNKGRRG